MFISATHLKPCLAQLNSANTWQAPWSPLSVRRLLSRERWEVDRTPRNMCWQGWEQIDGWSFFDEHEGGKPQKEEKKLVVKQERMVDGKIVTKTFELC